MSGMWKQLFSEAPPGALNNLLSPKRKLFYALFALTPGTLLGLYLNSVKNEMERKNEQLRLQQVEEELAVETEREQKDLVLLNMIQDLRTRLQWLEQEALEQKKQQQEAITVAAASKASALPAAPAEETKPDTFLDQQTEAFRARFHGKQPHTKVLQDASGTEPSGIGSRVRQIQKDLLKQDVREFKRSREEK